MLIALGASLHATQGPSAPATGQTYSRAQHLCQHLDDPHQLFPVLRGLWQYHHVRTELRTAHALGTQLLTLARQVQDSARLVAAHRAVGITLFYLGAVAEAHTHFTQGIALYDSQQHRASTRLYGEDSGVMCQSFTAHTLCFLGYPDQALARSHEALTLAQQVAHPLNLAFALFFAAMFYQFRREMGTTQEHAEAAINLVKAQGFPYLTTINASLRGWALAQQGQAQEGIKQMRPIMARRAAGAELRQPYLLALLAETYGILGGARDRA